MGLIICSIKITWKEEWIVIGSYKKQPEKTDTKPCAFQIVRQRCEQLRGYKQEHGGECHKINLK